MEEQEQAEIIYIPDDEGNEEEFEVLMKFETEGGDERKYMMVTPVLDEQQQEEQDEEEVYAFRYEEDGDDLKLFTIEDEEEWNMVEETFNTILAEYDEEQS